MADAAPTIDLLLPSMGGGGAERVALTLADGFAKAGLKPRFILVDARGELLGEAERFGIVNLAAARLRDAVMPLTRHLRRDAADATLVFMWPLTSYGAIAHLLAGRPGQLLVSDHVALSVEHRDRGTVHSAFLRGSMAITYRLADRRIAVSHGVASDLSQLSGLATDRFTVIHNPIPAVSPAPESNDAKRAAWRGNGGARILTVGSMKPQKNHALLLESVALLARQRPVELAIIGEGPLRGALTAQAQALGIAQIVTMPGFADPAPWYRTADLFVLSSDYEGFGNVLVEAMSAGLNVVSTDCPSGPAEIVENGRFGRLSPVGDAQALANAMAAGIDNPFDKEALIRRASRFAPQIAISRYLDAVEIRDRPWQKRQE